ncbi:MAG: hypothetical protein WC437_03805, partial [Patescibacteria group bacterium]
MKKARLIVVVLMIVIMAMMIFAATAQATFVWSHVGGDPLHANVTTQGEFSFLMLNSSKVRLALGYVRGANHQPSWVLPNAYKEVAKGNIHSGTVSRGTHLGAMSYGRYAVRVVKDTIYRGQYKRLPIFYVVSKSVTTKTIGGVKYRVTTSYWVSMAKPCGNVFIFHKRVTKVKVPPEKHAVFVKKINADTGEQLANWLISGGGKSVTTLASGWVKLGDFEKGNHFPVSEELKFGWMSVSPLNGVFPDVMIGDEDVYLTFSNKPIPPEKHAVFVKKINADTGEQLANWLISGGGKSVTTLASGWVKL